jgi:uncharacterized protein
MAVDMRDLPGFQQLQQQFATHIRTQGQSAIPKGVADARMAVYRQLFFNNVQGFLNTSFPVCSRVLAGERWQQLARDFFRDHRCETPYFYEVSAAFLDYLQARALTPEGAGDPPWLYELAHYEWLELAVEIAADDPAGRLPEDAGANKIELWLDSIYLHPASTVRAGVYQYPVHQIGPDNPHPEPVLTTLLVFRDLADKVRFLHTSPFTLALFEQLQHNAYLPDDERQSAHCVLESLLETLGLTEQTTALQGGREVLAGWCRLGILVRDAD